MAPAAGSRAALQENGGANARTVINGITHDVKDNPRQVIHQRYPGAFTPLIRDGKYYYVNNAFRKDIFVNPL